MSFQRLNALVARAAQARGASMPQAFTGSLFLHVLVFAALAMVLRQAVVSYISPHQLEIEFGGESKQPSQDAHIASTHVVTHEVNLEGLAQHSPGITPVKTQNEDVRDKDVSKRTDKTPESYPVPNEIPLNAQSALPKTGAGVKANPKPSPVVAHIGAPLNVAAPLAVALPPTPVTNQGTPYVGSPTQASSGIEDAIDRFAASRRALDDAIISRGPDGSYLFNIVWPHGGYKLNLNDGFQIMYVAPIRPAQNVTTFYLQDELGVLRELPSFKEPSAVSSNPPFTGTLTYFFRKYADGTLIKPGRYHLLLKNRLDKRQSNGIVIGGGPPDLSHLSDAPEDVATAQLDDWITLEESDATLCISPELTERFFQICGISMRYSSADSAKMVIGQGARVRMGDQPTPLKAR